jgi:hypothetical protein
MFFKRLLLLLTILTIVSSTLFSGTFGNKYVLIIGIDGCRPDAILAADAPVLASLRASGAWTHEAFAGGILGTPSQQVTSSGPSWSSILTGVWTDKHGVTNNSFSGSRYDLYPCFFERIKETHPDAYLVSIVNWGPINDYIVTGADIEETKGSDEAVAIRVAELVQNGDPDVIFVQFDELDGAGHSSGYAPDNPNYVTTIERLDSYIGIMVDAIKNRPNFESEDWQILVTADHGGKGTGHGGQSEEERTIFIYNSCSWAIPGEFADGPGHTAIPPTAMYHLGLTIDTDWLWEDEPVGLVYQPIKHAKNPRPRNGAMGVPFDVTLEWDAGADAMSHNVYFGKTSPLTNVDFKGNQTETTFSLQSLEEGETYYWRIDEVTNDSTVTGKIWNFTTKIKPLDPKLLGHWSFDGLLDDQVGEADGSFNGATQPTYIEGVFGKAIRLDGINDYVILGDETNFNFGDGTDFSVSLWVRTSGWNSDATIISNKDWNSGGNVGWGIFGGSGTGSWQWNYTVSGGSRVDYDPSGPVLKHGNWHHLCVTHDRDGSAIFYFDGVLQGERDISQNIGSIDAGFPTVVGTDGAEGTIWPYWFKGDIDELKIYSYVLNQEEIIALNVKPQNPSLIGHWTFDNTLRDATGEAHGTFSDGTPAYGEGKFGQAVVLDGLNDHIVLGDNTNLNFGSTTDFSVSLWVKTTGWNEDASILSNKDWDSGSNTGWIIAGGSGKDTWQWNYCGSDGSRVDYDPSDPILNDDNWHHLCVSHDRDGVASFYFDGALQNEIDISGSTGSLDSGLPVVLGTDGAEGSVWAYWFAGSFDELKIFNYALASEEIFELAKPKEFDSALIAYYSFDNTLADALGNAQGWFSDGAPTYETGKFGKALILDGENDYVILGDNTNFKFGEDINFSISLWLKTNGWIKDPAIISNKDWSSGSNTGWGIFAGDNTWQWNYCVSNGSRVDYDPHYPTLHNDLWHHLCVTHDRGGSAKFYIDGEIQSTIDISGNSGTIDSGFPTVLGQDGTTNYPSWLAGSFDELAIYNRVLRENEVKKLVTNISKNELFSKHVPTHTELINNYPNPFNPQTTIQYSVPKGKKISLRIFDIRGRKIRTLVNCFHSPGYYEKKWDSKDEYGAKVPSGLYFYQLKGEGVNLNKKMLLIK